MELDESEFERGNQQGLADVAAGAPLLYWQTRGAWGELFTRLMTERYSVTVQHISDITYQAESSYRAGYNRAVIEVIDRRHGAGAFASVLDEVETFRKIQYQRYLDSSDGTAGATPSPSD